MHLPIEDYAGMNKSMLWEKYFYNYEQCNKIVEKPWWYAGCFIFSLSLLEAV